MRIEIDIGECRNEEVGDWQIDERGVLQIRTAKMPIDSQFAVAIHELTEWRRCQQDGITDEQVTRHDAQFLKEQKAGLHPKDAEAGSDVRAPYKQQHADATFIERCFCAIVKLPWREHERNVENACK